MGSKLEFLLHSKLYNFFLAFDSMTNVNLSMVYLNAWPIIVGHLYLNCVLIDL